MGGQSSSFIVLIGLLKIEKISFVITSYDQ